MYAYVKNKFVKQSKAFLSIYERGFRFGDGFFDTILIDNFQPYQWQYHKIKLGNNLRYLSLNANVDYIEELTKKLIAKNQFERGLLRVSISRGIGGQGYQPLLESSPTIIIETIKPEIPNIISFPKLDQINTSKSEALCKPFTKVTEHDESCKNSLDHLEVGNSSDLWISILKKIPASSINPNIKLMSGTQNILAKIEAMQHNCCEALLLDEYDNICEGASSNIFWIKNNIVFTPTKTNSIYQGSIRAALLNLFPNIQEVNTSLASLKDAEEVFFTNTAWKIKSISRIKNLSAKIFGSYYTNQIAEKLREDINEKTRHFNAWQL